MRKVDKVPRSFGSALITPSSEAYGTLMPEYTIIINE